MEQESAKTFVIDSISEVWSTLLYTTKAGKLLGSYQFVYINQTGSRQSLKNPLGLTWAVYKSKRNARFSVTVRTLSQWS